MSMRKRSRIIATVHHGKPLNARGWKLPCLWIIYARAGDHRRMRLNGGENLDEARALANSILSTGVWDFVDIVEQEKIQPRKR
jgi:hypothetical protein